MALFKRSSASAATKARLEAESISSYVEETQCSIADAPMRIPIRITGAVQRQGLVPRAGSTALEIVVSDGTADAFALFTGRKSLGGIEHGREVIIEGVAHIEGGRRVFINPSYTLQ